MSRPAVSIIMPYKNAAAFLRECLHSILQQSFERWELIAVNDHSEDDSEQILMEFANRDPRISTLPNKGQGIIPALQTALANSSGLAITRMDADDLMPPQRLMLMKAKLDSAPPQSVVTGLVKYFPEDKLSEGYRKYESWLNEIAVRSDFWKGIYRECTVASPNWMMRTDELLEMGGFSNLSYPEDYDLVFQWYKRDFQILTVRELTLLWREHPDRTSRNSENYGQLSFFKMKLKYFLNLELKDRNLVIWGTGKKAGVCARLLDENNVPFQWMALDHNKHKPGIQGHSILSHKQLGSVEKPILLISVYPDREVRNEMNSYLNELELREGRDFWYL